MTNTECYFGKHLINSKHNNTRDMTIFVDCKVCGKYFIGHETAENIDDTLSNLFKNSGLSKDDLRHRLSCYIREKNKSGLPRDTIYSKDIEKICIELNQQKQPESKPSIGFKPPKD